MTMRIPVIQGVIDRRILVNYRVDPQTIRRILPQPFEPKLVHDHAIAGICLIRLRDIRPRLAPRWLGIRSENAAHRIAVTWRQNGQQHEGVYIPRRDTDSRLNALVGGCLFPGLHHHARFHVREVSDNFHIDLTSDDQRTHLRIHAQVTPRLPDGSIFNTLDEASGFFQTGSLGYSRTAQPGRFDGIELRCRDWQMEALKVEQVYSSFFADETRFPAGAVAFDCALLMRHIEHEWHGRDDLCCPAAA